jgi:capsular exopolysaccharide synthesis family protein
VRPKKLLNILLAFLIGLAAGTGGALLLEAMDQSIKSIEDIQKILSVPLLGSVPLPKQDEKNILPALMTLKHPSSVVTEAYKSLRTNIMFSNPDMRKKAIVVTSAGPREGKTTVATNLATAMAHAGEKTLLVDADFRYPKLHEIFGLSRKNGITEILSGREADISSYINKTSVTGLDVLLCGAIPPNPSELLGSKSMQLLMEKLCRIYDRIIFDTPPVLAVTDAVILATVADATIFVTMSGQTYRRSAVRAIEMLNSVETKLLGIVLNAVRPADHGGYYHYYYNYPGKRKAEQSGNSSRPHEVKPSA